MKSATSPLRLVEASTTPRNRARRLANTAVRTTAATAVMSLFLLPHEISHYICLAVCGLELLRTVWLRTNT